MPILFSNPFLIKDIKSGHFLKRLKRSSRKGIKRSAVNIINRYRSTGLCMHIQKMIYFHIKWIIMDSSVCCKKKQNLSLSLATLKRQKCDLAAWAHLAWQHRGQRIRSGVPARVWPRSARGSPTDSATVRSSQTKL